MRKRTESDDMELLFTTMGCIAIGVIIGSNLSSVLSTQKTIIGIIIMFVIGYIIIQTKEYKN